MWFQFDAYEQDLPWIQPDLPVKITTPSHPGISFSGTIAFLEPSLNPATRTSKVRVELENPLVNGRRLFLHRLYADGWVQTQADETLTIPRSAVIETGSEAVAYVDLGEGQYTRRVLSTGRRGDTLLEILSGLDEGEKVVVNGNLLLDGQAEMNRSFALPTQKMPPLDAVQTQAMRQIFSWANTLSTALANDDLEQFNTQAANFHSAMSTLMNDFKAIGTEWHPHLRGIEDHSHFETSNTLEEARKQFYNFISSAVTLAQTIRPLQKEFSNLKVFECPMTKNVFPGAPTTARWIQESSTILNPFMGKKMLDCGIEVKP